MIAMSEKPSPPSIGDELRPSSLETSDSPLTGSQLRRSMSRRRFLGGALGGAAALVAVACGADETPTPAFPGGTPTSTAVGQSSLLPPPAGGQIYLPYVQNDALAEVAMVPTATPEPVDTPTPEPTHTDVDTTRNSFSVRPAKEAGSVCRVELSANLRFPG